MTCPSPYAELSEPELTILSPHHSTTNDLDDDTLDELFTVADAELEDFQRGGK